VAKADRGGHDGHDHDPRQGVADGPLHAVVGEDELVVVEADEALACSVAEAEDDRVDDGVDEEDGKDDQRRPHEHIGPHPLAVAIG
jgi:hypothetical protein